MGNILANDNIVLCGVLPGAFFSENNAMSRFQHFKPDEYKQFVEKLPAKRMPLATEYIETLKLISSSKSKIFVAPWYLWIRVKAYQFENDYNFWNCIL